MKHPSLFISHGAPNTILYNSKTKDNLKQLEPLFDNAQYIIMISAHWVSDKLEIINPKANSLLYDFYGFEPELYQYKYNIQSDKAITNKILTKLHDKNIDISINYERTSYDHGIWSVLSMIKKHLNIPVIQISLPIHYSALELFDLGIALQEFREEGLIIASGALTHNLNDAKFNSKDITQYAKKFNDEIIDLLQKGDIKKLLNFHTINRFQLNHPTIEHFIPLLIAAGASSNYKAKSINSEFQHANISMESFIFQA